MDIKYGQAYQLETIVTSLLNKKEKGAFLDIVSVDNFKRRPFDAALLCIGYLNPPAKDEIVIQFVNKFYSLLHFNSAEDELSVDFVADYIDSLQNLIKSCGVNI